MPDRSPPIDGGGGDVDGALFRYQRRRYEFVRAREILTEGLYDVFRRGDDGARALRSGLFRYWTSGPRARGASMSLLSGHDSRLRTFIAEYLSVVGESAASVIGGSDRMVVERDRGAAARGLATLAKDQLLRTAALVYNDVRRRQPAAAKIADLVTRKRSRDASADAQA